MFVFSMFLSTSRKFVNSQAQTAIVQLSQTTVYSANTTAKTEEYKFKKVNSLAFSFAKMLVSPQDCSESMTYEPKHSHQEANFGTMNLPSLGGGRTHRYTQSPLK